MNEWVRKTKQAVQVVFSFAFTMSGEEDSNVVRLEFKSAEQAHKWAVSYDAARTLLRNPRPPRVGEESPN